MAKKLITLVGIFVFMQLAVDRLTGQAAVFDNRLREDKIQVAPTVTYIEERYQSGSTNEAVNILDFDLTDPYTKLELGIPNPINSLKTTTDLAKEQNASGHRVVGAVNASFFLGNHYPANLLAQNNEIINYGILGENTESPTQKPVAFGISKTGKAIADYYTANLSFTVNGKKYTIDRINSERTTGKNVLYTSAKTATGTNEWGAEIVVTNASQNTKELHFGDKITGTVSKVTKYGEPGNSTIPDDGFVISVQNKELATQLSSLSEGTPIEVTISIDQKWQDAEFILAAGPLLVKDGKVNISMPTSSSFASSRQPRTAVAVDSTGTRVFLVTVDGRQSGYSNGTSLTDLASLLISKGASAAINFDGGGSTTMVARKPGDSSPSIVNRPSDGFERRVSAILQIVNTAPPGKAKSITLSSIPGEVLKGTSFNVSVSKAYDVNYNPLTINPADMTWSVEGNIGKMEGTKFTATAKGTGKIVGVYDGVRSELPITVIDFGDKPYLLDSLDSSSKWTSAAARATATVSTSTKSEPYRQGAGSLELSYDFSSGETGTKAAYAVAKSPIPFLGSPQIGVWAYGDGGKHWLRGTVVDGKGTKHTIDFTADGGFNWKGWKYVTADLPEGLAQPLKFERIYIAQLAASGQTKGQVYFDQLQAVYNENHEEPLYTDVTKNHWGYPAIESLNEGGIINGYPNGTFKPDNTITRAEAAIIIARALNLKATTTPTFGDVSTGHFAYKEIAAVAEFEILTGREAGSFSPSGKLTRAEMATILKRAYSLTGTSAIAFTDLKSSHWAYDEIQALVANELTTGYPDNTFRPDQEISRTEFAAFLDRVMDQD